MVEEHDKTKSEDEVTLPEERVEDLEPTDDQADDVGGGAGLNYSKIEIDY